MPRTGTASKQRKATAPAAVRRRTVRGNPEDRLQTACVEILRRMWPDVLCTATVGGAFVTIGQRRKLARNGYQQGVPDLLVFEARNGHIGLAVEFKSPSGTLSPEQRIFHCQLEQRNWKTLVIREQGQFEYEVCKYFGNEDNESSKKGAKTMRQTTLLEF